MKVFGAVGLVITSVVLFGACSLASVGLGYGWAWFAAPWQGKLEARQEIQSGASRIVNYEHFFNLCASIQTNEAQIDALNDELKQEKDAREQSRIRSSISGVTAARSGAINQYNVDASKSYTQGQFRDAKLPFQLALGGKTSCV